MDIDSKIKSLVQRKKRKLRLNQTNFRKQDICLTISHARRLFLRRLGFASGVSFKEIQILRDPKGKPYVNLSGNTKKISNKLDIKNIYVSITDTSNLSTAFVIGE